MSDIVEKIKKIGQYYRAKEGCSFEEIRTAEKKLDLKFPAEYVAYVTEFGYISFGSTEWTGLNIDGYLNTVDATEEEKSFNDDFPNGCFVLEDLYDDGWKAIVDEKGAVFLLNGDRKDYLCGSMSEYLDRCIGREIVSKINGIDDLHKDKGCTAEQIEQAQSKLGLTFPEEYKSYVKNFGCISFGSTKWTGLGFSGGQNTVEATNKEKSASHKFPDGFFVLELLNDGKKAVIVNEEGRVFTMENDRISTFHNYTISQYLDYCLQKNQTKTE